MIKSCQESSVKFGKYFVDLNTLDIRYKAIVSEFKAIEILIIDYIYIYKYIKSL